jgi:hypothetical protein
MRFTFLKNIKFHVKEWLWGLVNIFWISKKSRAGSSCPTPRETSEMHLLLPRGYAKVDQTSNIN